MGEDYRPYPATGRLSGITNALYPGGGAIAVSSIVATESCLPSTDALCELRLPTLDAVKTLPMAPRARPVSWLSRPGTEKLLGTNTPSASLLAILAASSAEIIGAASALPSAAICSGTLRCSVEAETVGDAECTERTRSRTYMRETRQEWKVGTKVLQVVGRSMGTRMLAV